MYNAMRLERSNELLELTARLRLEQVVAATEVLARDEDVRHSALAGLLTQVALDARAVLVLVELQDADLGLVNLQRRDDALRARAVRAVRLAKDSNGVLGDELLKISLCHLPLQLAWRPSWREGWVATNHVLAHGPLRELDAEIIALRAGEQLALFVDGAVVVLVPDRLIECLSGLAALGLALL